MEKLFKVLSEQGKYTKSLEDFQTQFGSIEGQKKLYEALESSGDYTKSFEDFSNQFFSSDLAKINDSASADPTVESSVTGFKSEEPLSAWQSIKNSFSNLGEQVGDIYEFWFTDEGANSALDIATNSIFSAISGQDSADEFAKKYGDDSFLGEGIGSEATLEAIKKYEIEKAEFKDTKGIIESIKEGDVGGVLAGAVNALTSMVGSGAYGALTLGTGTFSDYVAENYVEFNKLKAENLNVSFEELIKTGKADNAIPVGMGAFSTALEFIGLGSVAKGIKGGLKGGGSNAGIIGTANKYLAEKLIYNTGAKTAMKVISTGSKEFTTEILQHASDQINLELGRVSGTNEEAQIAKTFIDAITSQEGLEAGIQGFIGGSGMTAGSYSAKAMSTIRSVVDADAVNKALNEFAVLKSAYKKATDKTVRKGLQNQLDAKESEIAELEVKGQEIYESLDNKQISKIENLRDLADAAVYQVTELNKKLRRGEISEEAYELSKGGFDTQYKEARQSLIDMELEKNIGLAKKKAESKGLDFTAFETTSEVEAFINSDKVSEKNKKIYFDNKNKGYEISGFAIGNNIIINKELARKTGSINIGMHEVLHPVFKNLIGDNKKQGKMVREFKKSMTSSQRAFVEKQMKKRGYTGESYNTEYVTVFSDALRKKQINYDKTVFEKIGDAIVGVFKPVGYTNIGFESGKDVYNFIKEYDKSAEQGKFTVKAEKAFKEFDLSDAKLEDQLLTSKTVAQAEADLQAAEDADPNDPSYLDNLEKAEIALEEAEEAAKAPKPAPEPVVKKEVKPKVKVARPEKPKRTTDLGPRDPISKKIMSTYDEGMEGVDRPGYKANKPLPAFLERKLIPLFEGYINTIVQQKFKQASPEALEFQDALSILRAEVSNAIRTFNPAKNKDLAGYVKKIVQTRQSLMFKDASKEFTSDIEGDAAKGVVATEDEVSVDRSGAVERGQATFDQLEVVDDALIEDISKELEKEIRVRTQKGTLSEARKVTQKVKGKSYETLVPWIEDYVEKTLFKKLSKKLGAVGQTKDKVTGEQKTRIPGPYIDFLNDENTFDIITKALPIKTLKSSYSKLFKVTKVGREKTAEGNPIFKVEPTTPKAFLQYFLDGKYGTLLARQKQLFREILRPVAKEVVANYATVENISELKSIQELAPETSIDIASGIALEAQLNNLESILDRYKGEEKSFDIIQFSKNAIVNSNQKTNIKNALIPLLDRAKNDAFKGNVIQDILDGLKSVETFGDLARVVWTAGTTTLSKKSIRIYRAELLSALTNKLNYNDTVKFLIAAINSSQKVYKYQQKVIGFNYSLAAFKSSLDKAKNDGVKKEIATLFLKYISRSIRTLGLNGITKNSDVYNNILIPAIGNPAKYGFALETDEVKNRSYIVKDKVRLQGLADITNIKADFKNNVRTINKEAADVRAWLLKEADKAIEAKDTDAFVGFLSLISADQRGVIRKMNSAGFAFEGLAVKDSILEHETEAIEVFAAWKEYVEGGKGGKAKLNKFLDGAKVNLVSKKFDALLRKVQKEKGWRGKKRYQDKRVKAFLAKENIIQFSKSEGPSVDIYHGGNIQKTGDIKGIVYFSEDKAQAAEYAKGNYGEVKNFVIKAEDIVSEEKVFEVIEKLGIQPKTKGYKVDELNLYELIDPRFEQESFSKKDLSRLTKALKKKGIKASRFTDTDLKTGKDTSNVVVFDKSVIQESDIQFSKGMNEVFNDMIERATGIETYKRFSKAKGKVRGRNKGRFKFFIPPSADDFAGLLYRLLGKKEQGNLDSAWFKEKLFDPFAKGIRDFESYKQRATKIVAKLKKDIKNIPSGLSKINETGFTNEQAVRVYLWVKNGHDIDGLTATDQKELIKIVNDSPALKRFAEEVDIALQGYPEPNKEWLAGSITTDAINMVNTAKRAEFLKEWQANADLIFSEQNLNKLRAAYGDNYVEALKDMLYRMKTGRNRPSGANKLTNKFMNWVNDSVGTIMFFNTRSALLQTLSIANFINWGDNNPAKAAMAFANQKQFWADFAMLFNSDFLKQRRSGLKTDVNADDIASAAETSTNKAKAVLASMLKMGFLPTQIADSFAIAMGGASFIRNRINALKKEGMTEAEATDKAFLDFQEIAEETQQSSRPDRISQQQASPLGRIILAFANTPMQYMRLTKKAFLDLKNGRGDKRTNISKIAYYMFVQNIIFSALQTALFSALFDDDEEELDKKELRIANSMLDSILRGVGVYGAIASTGKNIYLEIDKQSKKPKPDFTQAAIRSLDLSPPISSKIRKLMSAGRAFSFKTTREKMVGFDLDNPAIYAGGQIVSALTNIPLDRAIKKADNLRTAVDNDTKFWQSVALALGYSKWDLGLVETSKTKGKKSKFGVTSSWKRPVKKRKFKRGE